VDRLRNELQPRHPAPEATARGPLRVRHHRSRTARVRDSRTAARVRASHTAARVRASRTAARVRARLRA
jgi:hypothetical protein